MYYYNTYNFTICCNIFDTIQYFTIFYNILQYISQYVATFYNILQYFTTRRNTSQYFMIFHNILQHFTTFYNIYHVAIFYNILQYFTTIYCNILQYATTTIFYNILQYTRRPVLSIYYAYWLFVYYLATS